MSNETDTQKVSKTRKLVSGANAIVIIVATVGIAIALNAISSQVFSRVDLTENKIYTLSEASERAVDGLDEPVHVKAFISPDLPPPMHNLSQTVADTLDEYAAASGDKLTFEIISPEDGEEIEEDAKGFGCEKVAIGQQSEDEVSLRAVYKCVAFTQGENLEVVDDLQAAPGASLANYEYEFTKALLNLQETEPRKLAFVSGFGGPAQSPQFLQSVQPVFEQLYGDLVEVTTVDLAGEAPEVGEDVSALLILNAEQPFSDAAIFALDQYVQRGGSVGWFQSATGPDAQAQQQLMRQMQAGQLRGRNLPDVRAPLEPGLSEVFKEYGLELRADLVVDPENGVTALAATRQGLAQITQPGAFMTPELDRTLPFMRDFSALAMPVPSTIVVQPWVEEDDDVEAHRVIQTADTALRRPTPPRTFSYETLSEQAADEEQGQWTLAATLQGEMRSYYDSNPLPEGRTEADLAADKKPARLLVVGSGDFFRPVPSVGYDQQLASLGGQFFVNSVEWLIQDTALTQIRTKAMPRLLGEVPEETKHSLQFVNIAAVPAVFALIGVFMMSRRRRRRESLDRTQGRD
ncbi:hypothetical protein FIV42_07745 [Persicimonas caeni]|uniref:ABC-type uncharacterized transport system domain-containing protein n=1 Tax=Persicimonas caeni TaxID=2292766 RepID=A0A4Y6PRI4_PERCE|nr:GldG family protein [Persicimonas caeni]QDG50627.1 hypothetical protein FIV42_07745 [Persicimonas caeni]QED31848.1 hypothetical protein FRD00_07740 [Persicimonas caeni]